MQIFVYNTGIKYNFPMIMLNYNEVIDLIKKLDYCDGRENYKNLIKKSDYYNGDRDTFKQPYFVINNSHLLPKEIDKQKYLEAYYPLNNKNMSLLYEHKDKFINGEKEFLEYLEYFNMNLKV